MLDWEVIVFLEMFVGPSHDFGQVILQSSTHRTCVYFDPQFCHAHSESYWCFRNHYSLPNMFLVCFGSSPAPDWRCAHIQDRNQMLVIHFICHTCLPSCWCCSSRDSVGRVVIYVAPQSGTRITTTLAATTTTPPTMTAATSIWSNSPTTPFGWQGEHLRFVSVVPIVDHLRP